MKGNGRGFVFLGIVLVFSFSLNAELLSGHGRGRQGPMVLTLDPSVRSQALGGAFVAPADDGGSLYWNPAGLQRVSRQEVCFAHAALFGEQTQDSAVYVRPAWRFGERETWAVGGNYLADAPLELVEEGEARGTVRPSESVVSLGYSRPLGYLSIGLSAKYVRQVSFEEVGSAYGVDAGVQGTVGRQGWWGVSLANLGTKLSIGTSKTNLPLVLRTGCAFLFPFLQNGNILGSLQVDLPADDSVRGRAGFEYGRSVGNDWKVFLRTGYASSVAAPFTLGAGVEMKEVGINYAFSPSDELGASNRVDLRWRFGDPLGEETRRTLLFDRTRISLEQRHLAEAEKSLEEARSISPHSVHVRKFQEQISLQIADSLDPEVFFDQARRSLDQGDMESAELAYRKILLVRPSNVDAQKGLEKIAAMGIERRNEEARAAVARAKKRKKQELLGRAREAMNRGEWAMALRVWQDVLELDPKNGSALSKIAVCQAALARESLSQAAEAEAHKAEGVKKYEEGRDAYRKGDLTKAKGLFEEAVRFDPGNAIYRRAMERAQQENIPRAP